MSLNLDCDYIPESNPPQIKVILSEAHRKTDKAYRVYRQATYAGHAEWMLTSKSMHSGSTVELRTVMLFLQRGPIQSSSSQPCCKHHYFTPPSLSLSFFLLFCKKENLQQHHCTRTRKEIWNERDDLREIRRKGRLRQRIREGETKL